MRDSSSRCAPSSSSMASSGGVAAYLTTLPGRADGEALLDEAAQHVVDALARQAGLARDLGRGERVAPDQRQVRLRLVARQAQAGQLPDEVAVIHAQITTYAGPWCHWPCGDTAGCTIGRRWPNRLAAGDQSLPAPARPQPGRLVPVGRRRRWRGRSARGQADLPVDRLRRVPLVPRHGARVVRGRDDGARS